MLQPAPSLTCRRPETARTVRDWLVCLLVVFTGWFQGMAGATELRVDALPDGPIAGSAQRLIEPAGTPWTAEAAMERFARTTGESPERPVISSGINAPATWLHWRVQNPGQAPQRLRLTVDTAWIDHLTVVIEHGDHSSQRWETGDAWPHDQRPIDGLGFAFEHDFAPGSSDLYLRAQTADPLLLPVYLEPPAAALDRELHNAYFHAFAYGFLVALIGYNLLIWVGVRKRGHLLYAVYLSCFLLASLAYTGHGYAWLWPDQPRIQRFVILVAMVAVTISGTAFALRFLSTGETHPRLLPLLRRACWTVVLAMIGAVLFEAQALAAHIAFLAVFCLPPVMVGLGILGVRAQVRNAGYFLLATLCGASGAMVTALTVMGVIDYSTGGFRAAEVGMLADATLLALALAQRLRHNEADRQRAETLARIDPLTRLLNRRAFYEQAEGLWHSAVRNERPLSVIMLDLDHFKQLNDHHGHGMGDQALKVVAGILSRAARRSDVVTRWGGEEFSLLLPETDAAAAELLAERLRLLINSSTLSDGHEPLTLSASFGVAERQLAGSLEELITLADDHLRIAKHGGRDRVVASRHLAPGGAHAMAARAR